MIQALDAGKGKARFAARSNLYILNASEVRWTWMGYCTPVHLFTYAQLTPSLRPAYAQLTPTVPEISRSSLRGHHHSAPGAGHHFTLFSGRSAGTHFTLFSGRSTGTHFTLFSGRSAGTHFTLFSGRSVGAQFTLFSGTLPYLNTCVVFL